jgi:DNA polymerase III epsilon subunit-like protein
VSWADERMLAFDTETSGIDVESDRIVTACVAWVGAGAEPVVLHWLVAVDVDIPPEAIAVHGVTTEHAREHGVPARAALEGVIAEIQAAQAQGVPLVGMNMAFDLTLLDREWRRWHREPLPVDPRPCVDPMSAGAASGRSGSASTCSGRGSRRMLLTVRGRCDRSSRRRRSRWRRDWPVVRGVCRRRVPDRCRGADVRCRVV